MTNVRVAVESPEDIRDAVRLAESAACVNGAQFESVSEFDQWFSERRSANRFTVERIPFSALDKWYFSEPGGNIVHDSERFFTVSGLHVHSSDRPEAEWSQPIINQPEIGILGILIKEFDGVLHCLMQAKMEPGNVNLLQLSPTVQATRSNYIGVHRGAQVRYLDSFVAPRSGRVITDVLQSEHGEWFFRKRNRNMIIEVTEEVALHEDFCWLTIGQIHELLRIDHVIGMDTRTVLACAPMVGVELETVQESASTGHSDRDVSGGRSGLLDVLSRFTEGKARRDLSVSPIDLMDVHGWVRSETGITAEVAGDFSVLAVGVEAGSREVSRWTQPLFAPSETGLIAFLIKYVDGELHVLVHSRFEPGLLDFAEFGPTVQCVPEREMARSPSERPPFFDEVFTPAPERIRFDTELSEEGGRLYHACARYRIVELATPLDVLPEDYAWLTLGQLSVLLRHSQYLTVQARTLIACLSSVR
ncbi:NDP-hexose 2,3-dehydratase family protein [Sciscionella marina]|uniref:NDP-hexose 2,3-dehydratase family protein n=1 Tax=Sciscionella marina TaxID=508770 RepID=UPI0003A0F9EB|nr:NDP-hexose 2,3-dehydratase family protein [Sciscionella marina]